MWFDDAVVYQIYPLGLCGAPLYNDDQPSHRILRLLDWVEHIKALGADTVLLNPVCESDRHGYDTRDYNKIDSRLGTEEDFVQVCRAFHAAGPEGDAGWCVQPCGARLLGVSGCAGKEVGQPL